MKRVLCLVLVILMVGATLVGCAKQEEFEIQSCGSGFYFNRPDNKKYKIKALGVKSENNYFYLEDYFCSEELGQEYAIKKGFKEVGSVFLAKKSDHYNPEEFRFDVMEYNNSILEITPEMNYVYLYSSEPDKTSNMQIQIMSNRNTPIDMTLDGVRIHTEDGVPTIFSWSPTDINMILKGENELSAGEQKYTMKELAERIHGQLTSDIEKRYYKVVGEVSEAYDSALWGDGGDAIRHFVMGVGELGKGIVDTAFDAVSGVLNGVEGFVGSDGVVSVILPKGVSFTGDGTLLIRGGNGAKGGAATGSLFGNAKGGDGGAGGDGILCGAFLDVSGNVTAQGGDGGLGGDGSSGLFDSGSSGNTGSKGKGTNVANPRDSKK